MAGEYDYLFIPQTSTTEYAAEIQLVTTPHTINHPYRFHLEAYKLQTPHHFCGIPSSCKSLPWILV
jgi:hypothetical protein